MKTATTRRQFIRNNLAAALGAAALPSIIPASALGAEGKPAPSSRVNLGCIGVGPQGRYDLSGFLTQADVRVVALADVARPNLEKALAQVKQKYGDAGCATYADFRELLARSDIDAVLIATPDHWHVPAALAAVRAGKHVYLEKPMGLSVEEDQLLRKAVQQHKRVFQFGTQQRSSSEFYRACALVRGGRIGKLQQINVWCVGSRPGGSTTAAPVPDGLNYDFWLGPAPLKPYMIDKCFDDPAPGAWKTWWYNYDYALGFVAGWGVHPLDIAYWGCPGMVNGPAQIEGKGLIPTEGACNTAVAWDVNFTFADGVRMRYKATRNGYQECALNDFREWSSKYGKIADHGTAFEGADGWVEVHRGGLVTFPEKLAEEKIEPGSVPLLRSPHHARNFIDAIQRKSQTVCPIEDGVQADILCHLSDIAIRLNRKLTWDPKAEQFVKDKQANQKLALRPPRAPWRLS
jgi:predicted dehydrogenase